MQQWKAQGGRNKGGWIVKGLNIHGTVLELGPGDGRITAHILKARPDRLILADICRSALDFCLERFAEVSIPIMTYETDGHSLSLLANECVDLFLACGVFVHLDEEAFVGYVTEIGRVLKPGGGAAFEYRPTDAAERGPAFEYYDPKVVESWATAAGLVVISNNTITRNARRLVLQKAR